MKKQRNWMFAAIFLGLAQVLSGASQASPVQGSQVLYDSSGFIQGQQSFEQSFSLNGPGTLTVTLTNIEWPTTLSSLDLVVSNSHALLGPEMGAGTDTFKVSGPETVYAQWFGTAQGPLDLGVYAVKVSWAHTAPVPLPASLLLLGSGLALLAWQRRWRSDRETEATAA